MIRIAVTPAAFDAVVSVLPFGSPPYEPQPNEKGERMIWLEESVANKLRAASGPGESYSDVILRLFALISLPGSARGTLASTGVL